MALRDVLLPDWTDMSDWTAQRECEQLARELPHGFTLTGLETRAYCGRTHRVARFSRREAGELVHFAFAPGGRVRLGYDGRKFKPQQWQIESLADSEDAPELHQPIRKLFDALHVPERVADALAERFDLRRTHRPIESVQAFIDAHTSPPRQIFVQSMLVEMEAREARIPVAVDECDFDALRRDCAKTDRGTGSFSKKIEFHGGDSDGLTVERPDEETFRIWRRPTYIEVQRRVAHSGMRLPTCDEWEYLCGAGAPTLFRWGDDCPADFYPCNTCAEDRRRATAWALSNGEIPYVKPPAIWDLHARPNLFGLTMSSDTYDHEPVSDGPLALGGDGGCNICGGLGFFLGWLPLATAFRSPDMSSWLTRDGNVSSNFSVRRVIPLQCGL